MTHRRSEQSGFTLLELLISTAIFLVVSGAALGGMNVAQKYYRSGEVHVAAVERLRAALELMTQEIGQAGLPGSGIDDEGMAAPLTTSSASTAVGDSSISVGSTLAVIPGEVLTIGNGANLETVQVASTSGTSISIKGTFTLAHASGAAVYALGVFPGAILNSSATQLEMFGDLKGDGNGLVLVRYLCPASSGGAFTRTEWDVKTGTLNSGPVTLVDNVTACTFSYPATPPATGSFSPPLSATGVAGTYNYTMVLGVGISITSVSGTVDPVTGRKFSLTKSFLNIQPRNVLAANQQVSAANTQELQPYDATQGIFASLP